MKANFHLITETEEEVLACTKFIEDILLKRKARGTMGSGVPDTPLPTRQSTTILPQEESKPWFNDEDEQVPRKPENRPLSVTGRADVSPGEPSIVKIGSNTKEHIISRLQAGFGIEDKYEEHAKLLWARGEIKFDGDDYYID